VKLAMMNLEIDDDTADAAKCFEPHQLREESWPERGKDAAAMPLTRTARRVADIYAAYEKLLRQSNALDFDDLLIRAVKLLRESTPVREKWQSRFQSSRRRVPGY